MLHLLVNPPVLAACIPNLCSFLCAPFETNGDKFLMVDVPVWVLILNSCLAELKSNMYVMNSKIHPIFKLNLTTACVTELC